MKKFSLSYIKLLNFFIYAFPIAFLIGNFFINLIVVLVSLTGLFFYKKKLFQIKKNSILNFIIIFFAILLFSSFLEGYRNPENFEFGRSIFFLRYLLFLIVLRCMILENHLNFKLFFLSSILFASIVSLDIIFQYFYGYNILGFEAGEHRRAGLFYDEYVAGGYIQRFSILGFFSIPFFVKTNLSKVLISISVLTICFLGILLSGNRMPAIMFVFFVLILSLFFSFKKHKHIPQVTLIFITTIFIFSVSSFENFKINYLRFLSGVQPGKIIDELKRDYPELKKYKNSGKTFHSTEEWNNKNKYEIYPYKTGHTQIYITSIDTFMENPLIGRGIRSFRISCWEKLHLPNRSCQNHSHNFYLEILNDTGFVGLILLMFPILFLLIKNFRKYKYKNNLFFYPLFFSLIIEFFPLRSAGSFFSTSNAAFVFFLIGIFIGLKELKNKNFYNISNSF